MARLCVRWLVVVSLAVLVGCGAPPSGSDGSIGGVTVNPATATIGIGETVQLTPTLTGVVGNPDRGVSWTSTPTNRATVTTAGLVTGVAPGTVVIAATSLADPSKSGFADITVTGPDGAVTEVMLIPNQVSSRIEILRVGGPFNMMEMSTPLNTVLNPTAVAVGPDGRVYVASVSANPTQDPDDPFDDAGIVIYPPAALQGGAVAPVAVLTSPMLGNPFALTFDANGTLWVGNTWQNNDPSNPFPEDTFRTVALLAFRDVAGIAANAERAPDVVLATFQGDKPEGFYVGWGLALDSLHIDPGGHLWVTDGNSVTRIDDIADVADGTLLDLVPGVQIQTQFAAVTNPNDNSIIEPRSAVVAANGRLYVGNSGNSVVSEFSDAADLTGVVVTQPQRRFTVEGVTTPSLMTIDADGKLWFGFGTGNSLRRVNIPQAGTFAATHSSVDYTPGFGTYFTGGLTIAWAP